jgi:hypothetical protein
MVQFILTSTLLQLVSFFHADHGEAQSLRGEGGANPEVDDTSHGLASLVGELAMVESHTDMHLVLLGELTQLGVQGLDQPVVIREVKQLNWGLFFVRVDVFHEIFKGFKG